MYNSGNNPDLVKTAIDMVFYSEYEREQAPGEILATDELFFKQRTLDRAAEITEEYLPPGDFEETAEEEEPNSATIRTGNQKTHRVLNYKKRMKIPVEFYEDDQHDSVNQTIEKFGTRARTSRDKFAFAKSYSGGFSTVLTSDGAALYSNSHTAMSGDTIDNLETGVFNANNLETLVRVLRIQKAQDGEAGGHNPAGLLVPPILFPDAQEITKSELQSGTANNNLNYFSLIYPGLVIGTSIYLDSAYNSANANAQTSYYLVSRNHSIMRWVRKSLTTTLVSPDTDDLDRYTYKARYREIVSPISWEGTVASSGTV